MIATNIAETRYGWGIFPPTKFTDGGENSPNLQLVRVFLHTVVMQTGFLTGSLLMHSKNLKNRDTTTQHSTKYRIRIQKNVLFSSYDCQLGILFWQSSFEVFLFKGLIWSLFFICLRLFFLTASP